ncbi:uncharacterized protein LOC135699348 [Ochlerotatus camptorhynchus]|uniref:uncharacterized protein LOC135699348 n=1 Tax=Ochlerotatus camptorhynchus TaxID=644619 RepID=UPI0031CF29BF
MSNFRKRNAEIIENQPKRICLKYHDEHRDISEQQSIVKVKESTDVEFSSLHHGKLVEELIMLDRHDPTLASRVGCELLLDDNVTQTFWTMSFHMKNNLYLSVKGHDEIQQVFLFRLSVKVLHPELTIQVSKYSVVHNGYASLSLSSVPSLRDQGYLWGGRWIKLIVSLEPINIIVREEIADYLREEYDDLDSWTFDLRKVRMFRFQVSYSKLCNQRKTLVFQQEMGDQKGYSWTVKIMLMKCSSNKLQLELVIVQNEGDDKKCYYFIQLANERVILCMRRNFDYEKYRDDDDGYVMRKVFENDQLFSVNPRDRYAGCFEIDFAISAVDCVY